MTEEIREKAIFYFQDRLSKFCPADKNRPNEYEIDMFIAGYQVAMDEANERIQKLREALEFYASGWTMGFHGGELLVSVGTELNFEEVHQRARAALKEDGNGL